MDFYPLGLLIASAGEPTREVFVNIVPWMRLVFYGMILASVGVLGWRVWTRARLWWRGQPGGFELDWRIWVRRLLVFAAGQKRVHRRSLGGVLHVLLFSGFVVLTIGTTLLMVADQGPVNFHRGWYYLFYELTMDVFGVALCAGCCLALYRRLWRRPAALGHARRDWALLALLLALGVSGFLVEAFRLHSTEVAAPVARWSVVGHALDIWLLGGLEVEAARDWHVGLWWVHAILVAGFFASIPVTRFLHVLTGPANIAARPERPAGMLVPLKVEDVEATGRTGVAQIDQFTRQQLLSLDACMECGRCEEVCPAWATGKPLSPKSVVVGLRNAMGNRDEHGLHGGVIQPETLWACTMCQACVFECPVLIGHVDLINDLRRFLVGEGQIAGPPAKAMASMGKQFNPYGRPPSERLAWADGLEVTTPETNPGFEYLLWVGCAASFDPRAQRVARALVRLLRAAEVNFAVLGREERCTGDPARRLGDEFLFQDLAQTNVETLNKRKVRKVVSTCPHCVNTLKNEYPLFGGRYAVQHHSQLLSELIEAGRLNPVDQAGEVTFHDPCYLARVNGETAAPRSVIQVGTGKACREMPRNGQNTFCCGAGGGRMWFDEPRAERVSGLRAREAAETGAKTLATACPFCLNMMTDAMASSEDGRRLEVRDVAEVLLEACGLDDALRAGPGSVNETKCKTC